jgi:hypothetical protein
MLFFSDDDDSDKEGPTSGSTIGHNNPKPKNPDGEEKPEVSPCSYNPYKREIKKGKKSSPWGMSTTQRVNFENNAKKLATNEAVGPGKYYDSKDSIGNSGTVDQSKGPYTFYQNQSSFFKSNVERMAYLEPKVKKFVNGKLMKGSATKPDLQNGNVTIIPEITPGPGDYFNSSNNYFNENVAATKPHHLQFFGSTEERVPYYERVKARNDENVAMRGPGAYNPQNPNMSVPRQDNFHKGYSSSFISGRDKDLLFSGNANPAPGDYKIVSGVNRINGKVWSKISTFGSTEKRFKEKLYENPGPGAYNYLKKDRKKKAVSGFNFKSGTKRNIFDSNSQNTGELYNLQDYKSISSEIAKLSGGAPNNFTILKNERFVMPFNS